MDRDPTTELYVMIGVLLGVVVLIAILSVAGVAA